MVVTEKEQDERNDTKHLLPELTLSRRTATSRHRYRHIEQLRTSIIKT
jgi:hypothetical protein